jgi:uncharacterized repeat protein (TIGR03803 family)
MIASRGVSRFPSIKPLTEVAAMKSNNFRFAPRSAIFFTIALLMATMASAASRETVLHRFLDNPAEEPDATLIADAHGNLYGVTPLNGTQENGTVYELSPRSGGGWSYHILHVFKGEDGSSPQGKLLLDSLGNLYGTTPQGGANDCGTVFQLAPMSGGQWMMTTLHDFTGSDGFATIVGLTFDSKGNLYGGNTGGGGNGAGVAFSMTPASNGQWTFTVIHRFSDASGEGGGPTTSLVFDSKGNLYGGNINGIFVLTPNGDGTWTESAAYTFNTATDGQEPQGELTFDAAGNLYGTAVNGGKYWPSGGTAFRLTPGTSGWSITVLRNFGGKEGFYPYGGLVLDSAGNAYGTTSQGGLYGKGIVFKLARDANDHWTETILHHFTGGPDGGVPIAGVLLDGSSSLYGTTAGGGVSGCGFSGCGVVFKLVP